jgi:opacity protein-like surface antigen
VEVFARLGGASIKRDASANGRSLSNGDSGGGLSYGAGMKYNINEKSSVSLDYMSYYTKNSIKFNGVGIGISTKF